MMYGKLDGQPVVDPTTADVTALLIEPLSVVATAMLL
jgi:hypothetical protein